MCCQEEESISHLLLDCKSAQKIWNLIQRGLEYQEPLNLQIVLFGVGVDQTTNHIFSLVCYYIYREWLICSLEKRFRQFLNLKSLLTYLIYKGNVYSKCKNLVWNEVCCKIDKIVHHIKALPENYMPISVKSSDSFYCYIVCTY